MLTRREFLAASSVAAALAATPSGASAQTPGTPQRGGDAFPPTSPTPVIGRPSDNLGGTTVNVGSNPGDLQTAISAAINADGTHKGNTLVCPAGVTYNAVTLPRTMGSGWTCIRSGSASLPAAGTRVTPSDAGAMFKIQSSGAINDARIMFVPNTTSGWRFIGMEGTNPNDNFTYALVEILGHRMSFERCYLHARPTQQMRRAIFALLAQDLQFWDSWISECKEVGSDSQTIFSRTCQRVHIENCELQAASENILIDDQGSGLPSQDVTIKRNHLFKPLTWRQYRPDKSTNPTWDGKNWNIKNLFEIKWCQRLLFEGNICENNWQASQDGSAFLLNANNNKADLTIVCEDIMFRHNTVINSTAFMSLSTNWVPNPPRRIAVLNNLAVGIVARGFMLLHRLEDVWIEHNTIVPVDAIGLPIDFSPRSALYLGLDAPGYFSRLTLKHNIVGASEYSMIPYNTDATLGQWVPDRSFVTNAIFGKTGQPAMTGVRYYTSAAAAGINTTTGVLTAGSPLIKAAGDGTDLGVNFTQLKATQSGP
jgi:hypothetical protein